jgi:serine/threonine protein phosphatase PrpC
MNEYKTNQPLKMLAIGVGAVSETGQREQNQDRMSGFNSPFGAVYLVADGMGGHKGGAEASRMVADAFSRHLMNAPASSPPQDALTLAVRLANLEVLEKGRSGNPEFEGMGSTVVIALIQQSSIGMELITAHVGDSRIYLRRNDKLTQLTKDHTQVQWLIDANALDEASARNHPDASVLTRAMGHSTDLQVDISGPIPLLEGDIVLLCSDGLSGFANAEDIDRTVAQNPDPTKCADKLVQLALASGSNDNITVQILRIGNAAQTRRRARKTDPASVIAPTTSLWSNPWLWMTVAGLLLAAGLAYYWYRLRPAPTPAPKPPVIDNHKKPTDKTGGRDQSEK